MMRFSWGKYRRGYLRPGWAVVLRVVLLLGAISMLVPFAWMVSTALKDRRTMENQPHRWLPKLPGPGRSVNWAVDYIYATTSDFEDVLLEDFEPAASGRHGQAGPARHGRGCLLLHAKLRPGQKLTRSVELDRHRLQDRAVSMIAFWLKGDGSGHRLRVTVRGQRFVYESVGELPVQFEGWKEVYCFFRSERFDPLG
ncbi:MAG: hypothetical protein ACE5K7_06100, partial [Phycisphaerae bacterium]